MSSKRSLVYASSRVHKPRTAVIGILVLVDIQMEPTENHTQPPISAT